MFTPRCFTRDWIVQQMHDTGARDATNLEKCILALELVSRLSATGLDFVFKGGTCLVLHLQPVRRLSIDVDIATLQTLDRVKEALTQVVARRPFTAYQHQVERDADSPPTKHFRVAYPSQTRNEPNDSLQLDVMQMAAVYPQILERPVQTAFVEVETPATVRVPSTDCLLGDKLAAFAPRSIGVLYQPVSRRTGEPQEPRPIRIMKQLFDVGELFNEANDLAMVAKTHAQIFEEQNTYRGGNFTQAGVLDDTLEAAFTLSQIDLKPIVENEVTALFRTGVRSLNNHLFSEDYTFTRAKVAAARAALVTAALKSPPANGAFMNLRSALPEPAKLKDLAVAEPWNKLTALKKTSPEAFYRWYQARAMLG